MALPVLQGSVASTYDGVDSNPKTLNLPAGITSGEIVLLLVTSGSENYAEGSDYFGSITDMTLAHQFTHINGDCEIGIYWGLGSDLTGVSTVQVDTLSTDSRANIRSYASRWTGVDLAQPVAVFVNTQTLSTVNPKTITGTTTNRPDCKVMCLSAFNDGGSSPLSSITAGWSSQAEDNQAAHTSAWLIKDQVTAGASGDLTFTAANGKKNVNTIFVLQSVLSGNVDFNAPPNATVEAQSMGILAAGDLVIPPAVTVQTYPMTIQGALSTGNKVRMGLPKINVTP